MSWSFTWTGIGTDFDASLVNTGNGGAVASHLVEAVREAVSNVNTPVAIHGFGHNTYDADGNLLPGTLGQIRFDLMVPTPVPPPLSEDAQAPPVPQVPADAVQVAATDAPSEAPQASAPEAATEGATPPPAAATEPGGSPQEQSPPSSGDDAPVEAPQPIVDPEPGTAAGPGQEG